MQKRYIASEGYLEPCQICKIELFAKIFNDFWPLTVLVKTSVLDVLQVSEYASGCISTS